MVINILIVSLFQFLKVGFKETGLMGYVLERMYREQFQENLPDNWVQLLEVYSYFTFDKVVANKIIIYLVIIIIIIFFYLILYNCYLTVYMCYHC